MSGHLPRLNFAKNCVTEVEGCTSWYGRISPWFTGGSPTCKGPLALGFLNHHMGPGPLVLLEDHHWWSIEKSDFSAGHLGECLYHGICFKHTGARQRKESWWIFDGFLLLIEEILHQLRLVVYPTLYGDVCTPSGAGFLQTVCLEEASWMWPEQVHSSWG